MVIWSYIHLSMKTVFLVAISSARWVGEIGALLACPPYTIFYKDKITLRAHPQFLPKVPFSFHLNQPIYLSSSFPKPRQPTWSHATHLGCQTSTCLFILTQLNHSGTPYTYSSLLLKDQRDQLYPDNVSQNGSRHAYTFAINNANFNPYWGLRCIHLLIVHLDSLSKQGANYWYL